MLRVIHEQNKPIAIKDVAALERKFSRKFPQEYVDFLLHTNGGHPDPDSFLIPNSIQFGEVRRFYGIGDRLDETCDLDYIICDSDGLIPREILPIGCTSGIDEICIDYRDGSCRVSYWHKHFFWGSDEWRECDLYPVAPSLKDFLEKLEDFDHLVPGWRG
jgi:hypothetical protein